MTCCIPQLSFSFYRHQPICADFSGGQITSNAGLLPLRAGDQRHHLTADLVRLLSDPRDDDRVRHDSLALLRGNASIRLSRAMRTPTMSSAYATIRCSRSSPIRSWESRWLPSPLSAVGENAPAACDLVRLNDALLEIFIRLCGQQVRQHGEILLDIDSTDDPTHSQQQLSFFKDAYGQHMYSPDAGVRAPHRLFVGSAAANGERLQSCPYRTHAAALGPRLQALFPDISIKLRSDGGFVLTLLYEFCEFFGIQYALGISANQVFQHRAEPLQKHLKRRYRRTQLPQRSFSSFRHRARSWPHQCRICYKAEHTAVSTNLRFVITNCSGRASQVFVFYNDRGECENRIEEFKNGYRADRLSCHRFRLTPSAYSSTASPIT